MITWTWGTPEADYPSLGTAVPALLGAASMDDYRLLGVGDTTNSAQITLPSSMNGFKLYIDGGGFLFSSNYTGYDIADYLGGSALTIRNFRYKLLLDKASSFRSFIVVRPSNTGDRYIYNNYADLNNKTCNFLFLDQHTGNGWIYLNTVKNSSVSAFGGIEGASGATTGNYEIYYNTVYGCPNGAHNMFSNYRFANNNFTGNTVGVNGSYTSLGGNVTTDLTGDITGVVATDAMVDPANGDFTPIIDGPLLLPDGTYSGAIQLSTSRGYKSRNRLRMRLR